MLTDRALVARDGARLPLSRWRPEGEPAAVLVALHSFGDYRAAFADLGRWMARRGVAVYAIDQRGFGGAPHFGLWAGQETMVRDVHDLVAAIAAEQPEPHPGTSGPPLYLLGESMGGSVALAALAGPDGPPVAGLILAAPGVRKGIRLRHLYNVALWTGSHVAPAAAVTVARDDNPRLTEAAQHRLSDDPRVLRRVRVDTYWGLIRLADAASAAAPTIETPTLLLYGGADGTIPESTICALRRDLAGPLTGLLYPEGPHLLLQWRKQETVFADIREWLAGGAPTEARPGPPVPLARLCPAGGA